MSGAEGGDRLERALELFLAAAPASPAQAERLLAAHPHLADLLRPMLALDAPEPATDDDAAELPTLGDFRLLREIGRGGMGIVYEAWQRSLDRHVAVKVLSPALVASPAAVARLRREASAAGRLRHPHIVEVFGFGSDGDRHFFAMQLVRGVPLQECRVRFATPARAVALAIQLTEALEHAHANGLVHRDVKPANILVQDDDQILLTDFGVARDEALPSMTREGGFLGTLDYASPEQVRGETVDARTDVWAVGVLLHELLTGRSPFSAPTQQALLHNILVAEPPALQRLAGITADLAAVIDHALAKDRNRRYASATALLADLRAVRNGAPVSVRLPTPGERLRRWARREPWRAFAALAVGLCLPTLAAFGGYLWANSPRIAAAADAEAMRAREERLAAAWSELAVDSPERGLLAIEGMAADPEVLMTRSWLQRSMGQRDACLQTLQPATGPTADLLRRYWGGESVDIASAKAIAATTDSFECFIRAQLVQDASIRRGYLDTLLHNAMQCDELRLATAAGAALERHFPGHPATLRANFRLISENEPAQALALWETMPDQRRRELHLEHGVALERLRRLDEAVTAYRAAIEVDGNRRIAHGNLGLALRKLGQHEAAVASLRRATELADDSPVAWNGLGLSLRDAGRGDEAAAAFRRAMALAPSYGAAPYNLGNLLQRNGDHEGAIAAYRQATAAEPGNVRNWANLGTALVDLKRDQEALTCFLRATVVAPRDFIPWHNLSGTARRLGLQELALSSARTALQIDSKRADGHAVLADALLAATEVDAAAALAAARSADERAGGKELEYRLLLARALHASGDTETALQLLDEVAAAPTFAAPADRQRIEKTRRKITSG
jgi:tetratricopeptide (TPR) repeat protein